MMKRDLMIVGLALLLSGCGFQLRGTSSELGLNTLDVQARDAYGTTTQDVRQALENRNVNITSDAPYRLVLAREQKEQRAASYSSSARVIEQAIILSLDYQIRSKDNLTLLANSLQVEGTYVQDSNNFTGSQQEALRVEGELRAELVRRLMQRLSAISLAQLDELNLAAQAQQQAKAQAKERARAEAAEQPQQSPLQFPVSAP